MIDATSSTSVQIRPNSSILAVLSHLNYKAWYALAELVDNALQSARANEEALKSVEGADYRVRVTIDINPDDLTITVRDNAAGIRGSDFPRAFRAAQVPDDTTGLSEFGMGLKTAACWFAHRWTVRTTALSEPVERSVTFDLDQIKKHDLEVITVREEPANPAGHFTEIVLHCYPNKIPYTKTSGKVKTHLASIYRRFLLSQELTIKINGVPLAAEQKEILEYPRVGLDNEPSGKPLRWERKFTFDFAEGCRATANVGLLATGDTSGAGFALLRRNRLIVGSDDETYRPPQIFRAPNSYTYQRLFGEIDIEGVPVTHTKDGFLWGELEGPFIEALRKELSSTEMDMLAQAENYRVGQRRRAEQQTLQEKVTHVGDRAVETIRTSLASEFAPVVHHQEPPSPPLVVMEEAATYDDREFELDFDYGVKWKVRVEVTDDPAVGKFVEVVQKHAPGGSEMRYRLSLQHPFVRKHLGSGEENLGLFYALAASIAVAEAAAKSGGADDQGRRMRDFMDRALRQLSSI